MEVMPHFPWLIGLAVTAALVVPAPALAQRCQAPPGSSAVEQYCEAVPEGGGTQSGDDFAGSGGRQDPGGNVNGLSRSAQRELRTKGADGAAVVGLVAASSGGNNDGGGSSGGTGPRGSVKGEAASGAGTPSGSPLKAVSASVENGATVGGVFVWALLGVTLLILGLGWISFRSRDASGGAGNPASE